MSSIDSASLIPPWGTKAEWQEVNRCICILIRSHSGQLTAAVALAAWLRVRLESVFNLLDLVCRETCQQCPQPCCLHARPWFDFRDLLLLHLNALAIPSYQTIDDPNATCRYYGPHGCTLARLSRPWICTWYLCPTQTANLKRRRPFQHQGLSSAVLEIKDLRKKMEDIFIRATA